jgi:hypothetical protein
MKIKFNDIEFTVYQPFTTINEVDLQNILLSEKKKIEEKIKERLEGIRMMSIFKSQIFVTYTSKVNFYIDIVYIDMDGKKNYPKPISYSIEYPESIIDEVIKKFEEEYKAEKDIKIKKMYKWKIKRALKIKNNIGGKQ